MVRGQWSIMSIAFRIWLECPSPILPLPPQGDPKREHDELEVQPETLLLDVEEIVIELMPEGSIPGTISLRKAGQA